MVPAKGVLLTGAFGSGKTTVAVEMAEQLERHGKRYAAIDLDWLWWFDAGIDRSGAREVLARNLGGVVANYLEAGTPLFVLAWALRDGEDLAVVRASVPFDLRIAELSTPIDVIAERLSGDVTAERARNLATARRWLEEGVGAGLADASFSNTGRPSDVAGDVIAWLGWI